MNNRLDYPGIAGVLSAAILPLRIAVLSLMLIMPAAAPAGAQALGQPAFILSVTSYDELRGSLLYLARLAGQDYAPMQLDILIAASTGGRGLEGMDRSKPAGAYGWVGPHGDDSAVVLLIPVAEPDAFLDLLEQFNVVLRKGGDNVYRARPEGMPYPVFLRFANGYAYITARDKGVLDDDKLLAPAAVLTGQGCIGPVDANWKSGGPAGDGAKGDLVDRNCPNLEAGILSLIVHVDRIPAEFKELVLEELDRQVDDAKQKNAPRFETELQRKLRLATVDEIISSTRTQLYESGETSLRLELDRKAGEVVLTTSTEGRTGSAMVAVIQELAQVRSVTAGLLRKDAAVGVEMNYSLPEKLRELFGALLDDGMQQAMASAANPADRMALEALMPTLKAGELDWTFNLVGPDTDGLYAVTGGVKIRGGARLEQTFRQTPPKDVTTEVTFDVEKAGPVSIHRVMLKMDDDAHRAFGNNPVYLAFREDAVFFAVGAQGLPLIREAVAVAPTAGRVMELQMAASRLAPLAKERAIQDVARNVFADAKDGDLLRLTLEGGNAMKLRLSVATKLIEYVGRIGAAMK